MDAKKTVSDRSIYNNKQQKKELERLRNWADERMIYEASMLKFLGRHLVPIALLIAIQLYNMGTALWGSILILLGFAAYYWFHRPGPMEIDDRGVVIVLPRSKDVVEVKWSEANWAAYLHRGFNPVWLLKTKESETRVPLLGYSRQEQERISLEIASRLGMHKKRVKTYD